MKRWHQEVSHYLKQWKTDNHPSWSRSYVRHENELGRYRKRKAFDCGNTRCCLCHGDKYPKRYQTRQEIRADLSFEEQLREFVE